MLTFRKHDFPDAQCASNSSGPFRGFITASWTPYSRICHLAAASSPLTVQFVWIGDISLYHQTVDGFDIARWAKKNSHSTVSPRLMLLPCDVILGVQFTPYLRFLEEASRTTCDKTVNTREVCISRTFFCHERLPGKLLVGYRRNMKVRLWYSVRVKCVGSSNLMLREIAVFHKYAFSDTL